MPKSLATPPSFTDSELEEHRRLSAELFRDQRRSEGPLAFSSAYAEARPLVVHALEVTGNLLNFHAEALADEPYLWQTLRHFCGPPISEEDLWTLVGGPKFKRLPAAYAQDTIDAIVDVLDIVRFPWVEEQRPPSEFEREAAVLATSVLMANRAVGTYRRGLASKKQEAAVADILESAGNTLDPSREEIRYVDDMRRETFSRERKIVGAKCDVPVRLLDGRLLAIECKVSNGPKNSWKRLNREAGGKARGWKHELGSQIVTAVVLAGVFDLACLQEAQNSGLTIFWEHDLDRLADFVGAATAPT